jgi:probable rRNA maturation factor
MSPYSGLHIEIAWRLRKDWRARPLLRRVARFVAAAERFERGQLSIAIVGIRAMASMHERFMNLPGPTDVLTFDLDSARSRGHLDAEIVLCADVARRNVNPRRRTLATCRAELALYLVHGLLHLAGYDDHSPADSRRMHAREDELLQKLGLGAVYSARHPD